MRVKPFLVVGAWLLATTAAPAQNGGALAATLGLAQHDYAKDSDVEVAVSLANPTSRVVDVPAQALESATLLLDVRDASGRRVPTVPPPTPRADLVHFAPGQTRAVRLRLGVFSPPLRPGDYTVGVASSIASGSRAAFRIRAPAAP